MKKILIVEDDSMLRETTSEFLEGEGYQLIQAENGLNGIKKAMEEIPDLILCDIALPQLDGYQVYKTLQQNPSTELVPFIFLTAKTEKEDIRAGMHLGADDYITKPFDFDELLTAIQTRLDKYQKIINKTHENFYALLNNPLVGIYICREEKLVFHNSKFAEMLGYQKGQLQNTSFKALIHPDDYEYFHSSVNKCKRGVQKKFYQKVRLLTKDQQYKEVECSGGLTTLNNEPAVLGMVGMSDPGIDHSDEFNHLENLSKSIEHVIQKKDMIPEGQVKKLIETFDHGSDDHEFENREGLTRREIEVLKNICRGMTNQEIAEHMYLSYKTIDSHRTHLLDKTGSRNTADLVIYAVKNNLVDLD
jgi:PAS domain S-box-containing protein